MMSREPQIQKFKITGMDCASCARKIEVAVGRVKGASDVKVGVTSETLTVTLAEALHAAEVTATVKSLGYGIAPVGASAAAPAAKPAHQHDHDHDHSSCGGHHHDHAPVAKEPLVQKFKITGMDCASCARKIEVAVARIDGASDVKVGLTSETLTVTLATLERAADVTATVKSLGYAVAPLGASIAPVAKAPHSHDHDHGSCNGHHHDHDHDHGQPAVAAVAAAAPSSDDHAKPEEARWWQSAKGRLVLMSGALIAAAYAATQVVPEISYYVFLAAGAVGAIPVVKRAFMAARYGSVFTIEMLMTIAVIGAVVIGATEEAALVVFLFAVGEVLEGVAADKARASIRALGELVPKTAIIEENGETRTVDAAALNIGQTVLVRPGDRIPADGEITDGVSGIDESPVTGESVPKTKGIGEPVFAGSVNSEAALRVRVTKAAEDNTIARIIRLVEEAQEARAPTERFIDRFSRVYMPAIVGLAVLVAIVPPLLLGAEWSVWIYRALALLLIGCPCALVISVPASIAASLSTGARQGLLMKGGVVIEAAAKTGVVAFDKTGTLTQGRPRVTEVVALARTEREVVELAASVETGSSHPLALAIIERAKGHAIPVRNATEAKAIAGQGVTGTLDGATIFVGAPRHALSRANFDDQAKAAVEQLETAGKTVAAVIADGVLAGLIAMRDEPREDAAAGIAELKAMGIRSLMLTGDNARTGAAIAGSLGMEHKAELMPEDKVTAIKALSAEASVMMIGDGINDAPALAAAGIGVAMGSGTDVALETADAAILKSRVRDVAAMIRLARATMGNIRVNIAIALGLKAVFLVTTVFGYTGLWVAILADTGATVIVTANALRLLRFNAGRVG